MKDNSVRYTIVIPAYNEERFIADAVSSVKEQTYPFFECIIINDGSTDNTLQTTMDAIGDDKRFSIITTENKGLCASRNAGLEHAKGQYIVFFDADDKLDNDMLVKAEKYMEDNDVLFGGIDFVYYEEGVEVRRLPVKPVAKSFDNGHELASWYARNHAILLYSAANKVYRVSLLNDNGIRFDENCFWGEDRLFNYEVLQHAGKIRTLDERFYQYRQINEESMTHMFMPHHIDTLLYLHERKMEMLLPIADDCSEDEKNEFRIYDIRKEAYNAVSYLVSQRKKVGEDTFKKEFEYLDNAVFPEYFYNGNHENTGLIEYISSEVYDDFNEEIDDTSFVAVLGSRGCEYRVAKAFEMYGDKVTYVCSGGNKSMYADEKGGELLESVFMKNWLTERGVSESKIIVEDKSHNTRENLLNIAKLLPGERVALVTASFHAKRVRRLVAELGYDMKVYSADGPNTRRDNWYLNETGIDAVFAEITTNIVRL